MSEHEYERWRHGGWYVGDVRYPSGAVGCVSRNFADRKWRIACDPRPGSYFGGPNDHTYPNRDAAADAEREIAARMCPSHTEQSNYCAEFRGHEGLHHSDITSWDADAECEGQRVYPHGSRMECWTCTHYLAASDAGSTSLFVACLLASLVPAVLVFLLVAPLLTAMSGLVQA